MAGNMLFLVMGVAIPLNLGRRSLIEWQSLLRLFSLGPGAWGYSARPRGGMPSPVLHAVSVLSRSALSLINRSATAVLSPEAMGMGSDLGVLAESRFEHLAPQGGVVGGLPGPAAGPAAATAAAAATASSVFGPPATPDSGMLQLQLQPLPLMAATVEQVRCVCGGACVSECVCVCGGACVRVFVYVGWGGACVTVCDCYTWLRVCALW